MYSDEESDFGFTPEDGDSDAFEAPKVCFICPDARYHVLCAHITKAVGHGHRRKHLRRRPQLPKRLLY